MEYIKWQDIPDISSVKAYKDGYYIEAIQILHGYLEKNLQELLMLVGATKFNSDISNICDIANSIPFVYCLKALYVIGQFSLKEYTNLLNLNRTRNALVHDYYREPYEYPYPGYPKKKFDDVFNQSLMALRLLRKKLDELV
jgi:hypothetical protein